MPQIGGGVNPLDLISLLTQTLGPSQSGGQLSGNPLGGLSPKPQQALPQGTDLTQLLSLLASQGGGGKLF